MLLQRIMAVEIATKRWQALLDARSQQMDAAYARLGRTSADFWDRRARGFHRATSDTITADPLFRRLKVEVTPETTILDIGAGTGRLLSLLLLRSNISQPLSLMYL